MLKVRNCEAGYGNLRVLKGVSLHISPGEIIAIIGANGSGKSTVLKTIAGLIALRSGEVLLEGKSISGIGAEKIVRRGCALVPEGRQVFAAMSVRENLLLGTSALGRKEAREAEREDLAIIYERFPRLKERDRQLAGTLSGGEQQMLAIGRALMSRPRLLMLDEPSLGLAPLIVKDIFESITNLRAAGKTILLIEQNARAALAVADRGYVIETGQIMIEGTSQELLNNRDVQRAYLGKEYTSIGE